MTELKLCDWGHAGVAQTAKWNEEGIDFIVGADESGASGPIALLAAVTHTPVVSYWATAPSLSDKKIYPYFGRTIPNDEFSAHGLVHMFSTLQWNSIAILYMDQVYGQVLFFARDWQMPGSDVVSCGPGIRSGCGQLR